MLAARLRYLTTMEEQPRRASKKNTKWSSTPRALALLVNMSALVSPLPASRFTNICVYCGSSPGVRPEYTAGAEALGKELVRRNVGLVYGGGNVGLMGAVSRTVRELSGRVHGIIPLELAPVEITGSCVGEETTVVPDMHTRKALMVRLRAQPVETCTLF